MRLKRFTLLCDNEERHLIRFLAKSLQRSQGDAVRVVIREAVKALEETKPQAIQPDSLIFKGVQDVGS